MFSEKYKLTIIYHLKAVFHVGHTLIRFPFTFFLLHFNDICYREKNYDLK